MRDIVLRHYPDHDAERAARILGPASATAQAWEQCCRRRAAGEDVHLWRHGGWVLVGPAPSEISDVVEEIIDA